ncbi:MAG: hypothetical protein E7241_00025 [Lachnospiraceae bacterium]|nr:hypothetical protein [Lachnospiraceae bacterium]
MELKVNIKSFIEAWNGSHNRFIFSVYDNSGVNRPTSLEIRYSAAKYQAIFSTENWYRLVDVVEAKSHGTMYIVTDEYLFGRGIIEAKIASCNHNFDERFVVGVMTWIGEELFKEEKLHIPGIRRQDE